MTLERLLVPGRTCGECTICCTVLRIEEPELKKKADVPCPNLSAGGGCAIYNVRPGVCRTWYCGWRIMPFLDDSMRPDRAKVLIKTDGSKFMFQPTERNGVDNLLEIKVMNAIATVVSNNFRVELSIPTRPGFTNALVPVNDALQPSLVTMDFEDGIEAIKKVIFFGSRTLTLRERD